MTDMLFIIILAQIVLVMGGFGITQLCLPERHNFWLLLPFYWGVGCLFLYITGSLFVLTDSLLYSWHYVIAALYLLLFGLGLRRPRYLRESDVVIKKDSMSRWLSIPMVFMLVKICLIVFIVLHNPVIDGDATYEDSYVSMSKKIAARISRQETIAIIGQEGDSSLGPIILGAWPAMFIERWHNHAVSIPWLFAFLSLMGTVFVVSFKLHNNINAAIIITVIASNAYIISNHTIRPGYHGLLVAYFLSLGFGGLMLLIFSSNKLNEWNSHRFAFFLITVGVLGAFLSKGEGKMWSVFIMVILLSYFVNECFHYSWSKIIGVQMVLGAIIIVLWYAFGEVIFSDTGHRGGQLVPAEYNPQSMIETTNMFFLWNTFGIIWWSAIVAAATIILLGSNQQRIFLLYLLIIIGCLLFLANLTANNENTIRGTTLGRFLLHIIIVPVLMYNLVILILQRKKIF